MAGTEAQALRDEIASLKSEMMRLVGRSAALEEQVRLMRDELLKAVDGIKKRDAVIEKLTRANEDLALKLAERERRLALYENSNTPPSEESVIQKHEKRKRRQQLKAEGDSGTKPKKPGRKEGHKGASHSRKSDGKVYNTPGKCDHCGSKNLVVSRNNPIQRTDIEPIVVHTITIVNQECECLDCGQATVPKTGQTPGTSFGPNLQKTVLRLWEDNVPVWRIARFVGEMIGERISAAAVQNCLKACSKRLEPAAEEIKKSVAEAEFVNIDETRVWKRGKMCHAWIFATMYAMWFLIAGSRGSAVLDVHFPYPSAKVGCDGYVVYDRFQVRQRCWAHILRKAEFLVSHTDNRDEARVLYLLLSQLFTHAKSLAAKNIVSMHDHLVQETVGLADRYDKAGLKKFATELRNAAPYLFTFMLYPGMPPTNNAAERGARKVVIHRKVRGQLMNLEGMKMFGTLLTCLTTWRMQGLNVMNKLQETLSAA